MKDFQISIGHIPILIEKEVFIELLNIPSITDSMPYKKAVLNNRLGLSALKELADKADVPYPLFFAPLEKVRKQIKDNEKNLFDKFPTKEEIQVSFRGTMQKEDIELIAKDIGRKQEFLKKRILISALDNVYIGSLAKISKAGASNKEMAVKVREFFEINLKELRGLSKKDVLDYLCSKVENKGIFVSFSSHDFMPQRINPDLGLSGVCIKDKKFPYIFVNTRDGDDKPLILETSGRQIFTLVSMLVCIGMNMFVLSLKDGRAKKGPYHRIYSIAAEILIPGDELTGIRINNIDELKEEAKSFKVTPSMFLRRLFDAGLIDKPAYDSYCVILKDEIASVASGARSPHPVNGYKKYNGERFSHEVIGAYRSGRISYEEAKNVLFRKKRVDSKLFIEYAERFK